MDNVMQDGDVVISYLTSMIEHFATAAENIGVLADVVKKAPEAEIGTYDDEIEAAGRALALAQNALSKLGELGREE